MILRNVFFGVDFEYFYSEFDSS